MSRLMLTEEQLRILRESKTAVTVVGPDDQPVASMTLLHPAELQAIARLKQGGFQGPKVSGQRVHEFLLKLHEIDEREGVDEKKAKELLQRLVAGECL